MRIHSRVAVGSPAVRLVYAVHPHMLLAILATGAVVAGASLLPASGHRGRPGRLGHRHDDQRRRSPWPQDGDTILVRPGTYHESIAITEDITLRGDGDRGAVVLEFADSMTRRGRDPRRRTRRPNSRLWHRAGRERRTHREHHGARTLRRRPGEIPIGAVVIDGGAPVIEKVDVVLDGEPIPTARGLQAQRVPDHRVDRARSSGQLVGRVHPDRRGYGQHADLRGQHHHRAAHLGLVPAAR